MSGVPDELLRILDDTTVVGFERANCRREVLRSELLKSRSSMTASTLLFRSVGLRESHPFGQAVVAHCEILNSVGTPCQVRNT